MNRKQADEQAEGWSEHVTHQEVSIKSFDDLTLKGTIYQAIESTTKWVILAHGYHSNPTSVLSVAEQFHAKGFNVLSISMRAHAKSEGNYIGMGWLDRKDLLDWIDYVITNDSNAQIILHGTSMGGAAVTMASGEELPPNVKAIINDCGYTSVWDIFASELKLRFNLPAFPVLHMVNLVANFQVGYNFKEASALKQVKNSRVPMLFIHGDRDDFVPVEMAHQLYEVATVEKELLIIEGASHAEAKFAEPDVYYSHVFSFVDKYMKS